MTEVAMTARAVNDVKPRPRRKLREILVRQFVQMRDHPTLIDYLLTQQQIQWRRPAAILHGSAHPLHESKQRPVSVSKHLHLFVRLREMCRNRKLVSPRDLRNF